MIALSGLNPANSIKVNIDKLIKAESLLVKGVHIDALIQILEKDDDGGDDDDSDDSDDESDDGDDSSNDSGGDFDSEHPRWPAGSPDSTGGEFRPKDSDAAPATDSDPGSISADDVKNTNVSDVNNPSPSPQQGIQLADSGQIMTDANVDNSSSKTPTATSADTNQDGQVVIQYNDGTNEVRNGGSLAWRNNNPGNLVAGDFADAHGAIGSDDNGFAIFPDEATGQAAQAALLNSPSYSELTVDQAIARRSPSNENDTARLQASIRQITGLTGTEQISSLTPDQFNSLTSAIQRMEGWRQGTVTQGTKK